METIVKAYKDPDVCAALLQICKDNDGIDGVDDTVVGFDVGNDDGGVVDLDASGEVNGDVFSLEGGSFHAVTEVGR